MPSSPLGANAVAIKATSRTTNGACNAYRLLPCRSSTQVSSRTCSLLGRAEVAEGLRLHIPAVLQKSALAPERKGPPDVAALSLV